MDGGRKVQVKLLEIDHQMAALMERCAGEFEAHFRVSLGENSEVAGVVIAQTPGDGRGRPEGSAVGGYLAHRSPHGEGRRHMRLQGGAGGGRLDRDRLLHLPPFEGKGYGTAMALQLIEMAESSRRGREDPGPHPPREERIDEDPRKGRDEAHRRGYRPGRWPCMAVGLRSRGRGIGSPDRHEQT